MPHFIFNPKTGGHTIANIADDVELVHYRKYAIDFHANSIAPVILKMLELKLGPCHYPSVLKNIKDTAYSIAEGQIESASKAGVPNAIKSILENGDLKKKEQILLLKGVEVTTQQLGAIFLYADDLGYLFSNIRFTGKPQKYDAKDVPSFIRLLDDGTVDYSGTTPLTDGQLKNIVEQSKFIVARFLTRGNVWHCFLQDRQSIMGTEHGKMGSMPHLHYLSSAFGLDIEDVKKAIRNGMYPSTPVHIPLLNYRPQKESNYDIS